MDNNIQTLISDKLEAIQWLLSALVGIGVLFIAVSCFGLWLVYLGGKTVLEQHSDKIFRVQAEDLLSKDSISELIEHCEERLASHPNDVWAHWYIGQANFHKKAWHASKRSFERALELEPSWYSSIDFWLEKVIEKIDDSAPKLVE